MKRIMRFLIAMGIGMLLTSVRAEVEPTNHIKYPKNDLLFARIDAPVYNLVEISDWISVEGLSSSNAQVVNVSDQGVFDPEATQVLTRYKPSVERTTEGWRITFRKDGPQ